MWPNLDWMQDPGCIKRILPTLHLVCLSGRPSRSLEASYLQISVSAKISKTKLFCRNLKQFPKVWGTSKKSFGPIPECGCGPKSYQAHRKNADLLRFPFSFWIARFNHLWYVKNKTGWQFFQNLSYLSDLWDLAFATMFICSALEWRKISTSSQNISFFWQTSFQGSWLVEPSCWRVLLQCFHCILQTLLTSLHFRTTPEKCHLFQES